MRKDVMEHCFCFFTLFLSVIYTSNAVDSSLCQQFATFFPNLCQYSILNTTCADLCSKEMLVTDQPLACGKRSTYKRFRRIIGGTVSQIGQWPWHISLRYNDKHCCGGTILYENVIITAAHCVDKSYTSDVADNFTVVAGTNEHQVSVQKLHVKKIIKHKDYSYMLKKWADLHFVYVNHDIALIVLDGKLDLGIDNKEPICLPDQSNPIPENYQCFIVGFGMTAFLGNISDRLRHTSINTVPVETCNRPESFNNTVNSNMTICGGDGTPSVSPCNFDSGGGLVCKKNDVWYLTGIISSGYKCGGNNAYSMYTNVAKYKGWIAEKLVELQANSSWMNREKNNDTGAISDAHHVKSTIGVIVTLLVILLGVTFC